MNCVQASEMLFDYIKGKLDQESAEAMRKHFITCEECRGNLEDSQMVLDLLDTASDEKIAGIVDMIIHQALTDRASDIHIEPIRDRLRVRYRIDGILHESLITSQKVKSDAIIARFKVMSSMNVRENRIPQDGRIPVNHEGKDYDLRVHLSPTVWGEAFAMKVLSRQDILAKLDKLGLYDDQLRTIRTLIQHPQGLVVVAGPSGSGLTTLLYSMLSDIDNTNLKIVTIEDPVEYAFDGWTQIPVNKKAGLDFPTAIRSTIRHDPDVLMVGALPDVETARYAVEAATTGSLVLAALHAKDTSEVVWRLTDMGIERYNLASALTGIISMRLIRKTCSECKIEYSPTAESLKTVGVDPAEVAGVKFYKGQGCEACRYVGYLGRTGLFEVMLIDREMMKMISSGTDADEIRNKALSKGMVTLTADARRKVVDGTTTAEEVASVLNLL